MSPGQWKKQKASSNPGILKHCTHSYKTKIASFPCFFFDSTQGLPQEGLCQPWVACFLGPNKVKVETQDQNKEEKANGDKDWRVISGYP